MVRRDFLIGTLWQNLVTKAFYRHIALFSFSPILADFYLLNHSEEDRQFQQRREEEESKKHPSLSPSASKNQGGPLT